MEGDSWAGFAERHGGTGEEASDGSKLAVVGGFGGSEFAAWHVGKSSGSGGKVVVVVVCAIGCAFEQPTVASARLPGTSSRCLAPLREGPSSNATCY